MSVSDYVAGKPPAIAEKGIAVAGPAVQVAPPWHGFSLSPLAGKAPQLRGWPTAEMWHTRMPHDASPKLRVSLKTNG